MNTVWALTAVACLATCLPAHASEIASLDLDKLAPQSELIVVGVVTALSDSDSASDTISVRAISTLKGKSEAKSFSLRLRNKGDLDFDPTLAVGDQCVFFLKSIKDGRAELTYWGSVAVMPKKGNFSIPAKTDDGARPADPEKVDEAGKKRAALWEALEKALPKEYAQIDVYAENPSLTAVLFRSGSATLQFALKSGKVEVVHHMKVLGRINRITFYENKSGGAWILWLNGRHELSISGDK